jgi:hypothetical protein
MTAAAAHIPAADLAAAYRVDAARDAAIAAQREVNALYRGRYTNREMVAAKRRRAAAEAEFDAACLEAGTAPEAERPERIRFYSVTLAIAEPHLAATIRFDHLRAASEAEAVDVAIAGARNHFGGEQHPWQVERITVADR